MAEPMAVDEATIRRIVVEALDRVNKTLVDERDAAIDVAARAAEEIWRITGSDEAIL